MRPFGARAPVRFVSPKQYRRIYRFVTLFFGGGTRSFCHFGSNSTPASEKTVSARACTRAKESLNLAEVKQCQSVLTDTLPERLH